MDNKDFIRQDNNYRTLRAFQKAECVYDVTYYFANKFLVKGDRTIDQMDAHIDELMHEQRDINREQTETNNEIALQIEAINNALDQLRAAPVPKRTRIGFKTDNKE